MSKTTSLMRKGDVETVIHMAAIINIVEANKNPRRHLI